MCLRRALTSRNSREAIGVFLPTLRDLSRKVPSTSQYSSVDEPSLGPTTCGLNLRSAPSIYSQVFSVSRTCASASILSIVKASVSQFVHDRLMRSAARFITPTCMSGQQNVSLTHLGSMILNFFDSWDLR